MVCLPIWRNNIFSYGMLIIGASHIFLEQHCRSWWVLFVLRQVFVLACVKTGEVIMIDILALRTPLFFKTFGWFTTLMIVQARGWPFVLTFWSVADFCCLFGSHRVSRSGISRFCFAFQFDRHHLNIFPTPTKFPRHWLFWQNEIGLFNERCVRAKNDGIDMNSTS